MPWRQHYIFKETIKIPFFQFNIAVPFTPKSDGYRASPSLSDQSHVVAFVVDGNCSGVMTSAMLDKVRTLRMHANHRGTLFFYYCRLYNSLPLLVYNDRASSYRRGPGELGHHLTVVI